MTRLRQIATASLLLAGALASPAQADESTRARTVYVLGDSYTVLMQRQGLDGSIPGWKVYSSGRGGRCVGTGPSPNGLVQATKDRLRIAQAGTVVVELGTNLTDRTKFVAYMRKLTDRIRGYSPGVRVLWVEPGNFATDWHAQEVHEQRIADMHAQDFVDGIVPWHRLARAHPEWFAADPKHPNVEGTLALMGLIRGAVS